MPLDYYLLLGVPRSANRWQIKRAYRQMSHRHHPDHAGDQNADRFLRIKQAYDTLSHSTRRAEYDRHLGHGGGQTAEAPSSFHSVQPFGGAAAYAPSLEEVHATLERNFTFHSGPKSQPVHNVSLEIVLPPPEAARGGRLPIEIPVAMVCPLCQGTGQAGFSLCDGCDGHGLDWETRHVDVLLPAGVRDGTIIPLSLRHLGITNMYLSLIVRVSGEPQ